MIAPSWLAFVVIALFLASTWIAIWSRFDTWMRGASVALMFVGIVTITAAFADTLGRHRPLWTAYDLDWGEYLVLAAVLRQDEAIWLYLIDPERTEPYPVVLPWDNDLAQSMQEAMDGAPEGEEGKFILRIDPNPDKSIEAHPIPQPPALPPKPRPQPPVRYEQEA